jgi:hypothetical protein
MKTKLISIFLAICMVLTLCPVSGYAASVEVSQGTALSGTEPSGSGTAADPYQIGTEAQLWWFAGVVNGTLTDGTAQNTAACARLTADITMSADTDWIPIAPGNDITAGSVSYTGTFDGNYHSITGLSTQVVVSGDKYPDADYGMFGYVGASGAIKNLMLSANSVRGYNDVGVLCGSNYGTIENCVVSISGTAGSTGVGSDVGGVCGNSYGTVKNCIFTGSAYGISGGFYEGTVENCYYLGTGETDSRDGTTFKTAAQFASGEVCYLLNGDQTTIVWYQTCGTGTPAFSGQTVYKGAYKNGIFDTSLDGYTNIYQKYESAVLNVNVYKIANAGQLCWFAEQVNAGNTAISGKLTADIDLTGVTWSGIGNASNTFSGTFDGGGFAISNMNSTKTNGSPGLIYALGANGVVKKLTMKSAYAFDQNGSNKGIVVGANGGSIKAVLVTDSQIKMGNYDGMGGIAGNNTGTISNCGAVNVTITRVWGAVTGNKTAGAITENNAGAVSNCYSYGVTFAGGTDANAGALVATGTAPVNSYYLSTDIGTDNKVAAGAGGTAKTAAQFASGEVCWLLNGSTATGVWKQNIDNGVTSYDASPNFTGAAVYYVNYAGNNTGKYDTNGFCSTMSYSNTASTNSIYQPATLNDNSTTDDATDDYYEIANAGQLYWFAEKVNQTDGSGRGLHGKLTANITVNTGDVSGCGGTKAGGWRDWTPINSYSGVFDGCGKTISGLYLSSDIGVALFDYDMFGTVKNLTLTNSYFSGGYGTGGICGISQGTIENCINEATITNSETSGECLGGICGRNEGGTISGCTNRGSVTSPDMYVGGICGCNSSNGTDSVGTVENCTNSGTVTGLAAVGGICGSSDRVSNITNCYNTGDVTSTGTDGNVGGICGYLGSGALSDCGNTGAVSGTIQVGGIAGLNGGTVTNAYNTGAVSGTIQVGGIAGLNGGTVTNAYNTGAVSGSSNQVGGIAGYNSTDGTVTNAYYLVGCAKDGDGTVQYGIGNATLGSTTADVAGSTTAKTAAQFASGEVCWLLNGSASTGVWKQNIDNGVTPYDASPNFTGAAVYFVESQSKYTNSEVVSVDITWGAMDFTYSDGTWNAATHRYEGAGWSPDAEDDNTVTVKNNGTANVSVTLSYTPTAAYTATTGSFDGNVTAVIPANEEKKWLLSLSGAPSGSISKAVLGTLTITIGGE